VGGADGSIRFAEETNHAANAGLTKAMNFIEGFKKKYPILSYADLIQMASAEAISLAGGPTIPMSYGRKDADMCPPEGNLPAGNAPFPRGVDAKQHLRDVFHRMGFNDRDIVALSGAHTMGRAFKERSGTSSHGYGEKNGTKYTSSDDYVARGDGKKGIGMAGGQSWTQQWLTFDNSYFREEPSGDLMMLETDKIIREDPDFKPHFERYAKSQEEFFKDYADVHKRLSELGSTFLVPGGIRIDLPKSKL